MSSRIVVHPILRTMLQDKVQLFLPDQLRWNSSLKYLPPDFAANATPTMIGQTLPENILGKIFELEFHLCKWTISGQEYGTTLQQFPFFRLCGLREPGADGNPVLNAADSPR